MARTWQVGIRSLPRDTELGTSILQQCYRVRHAATHGSCRMHLDLCKDKQKDGYQLYATWAF